MDSLTSTAAVMCPKPIVIFTSKVLRVAKFCQQKSKMSFLKFALVCIMSAYDKNVYIYICLYSLYKLAQISN